MVRRDYYKVDRPPSAEFLFVTIRGPRPRVEGEPRKAIKWEYQAIRIFSTLGSGAFQMHSFLSQLITILVYVLY